MQKRNHPFLHFFCPFSIPIIKLRLHFIFFDAFKFNNMDNIQDPESISLLLYLTSAVLAISVIVIGYFMTRRDKSITAATDNLTTAVQQLKTIVNGLQLQYEIRQPIVDAQLEMFRKASINSAVNIKKIDSRLIKLETEHNLFHYGASIIKIQKKNDLIN